jgi:glycosyltransferase involved in cell wall biosynthesis
VIVDGASTDATPRVVAEFPDDRIRYLREATNEGVTAARNRGLDAARGDWLGMLDSDDELVPHALATLLETLTAVSPRLDAVSCNCLDAETGRFTGHGLGHDRFLTVPLSVERARGEHWGIFHRRIVAGRRFNPAIRGFEGHLWYRIHDGALWYYLHRGLRIYHREGADRNTLRKNIDYDLYRQIFEHDRELLALYARWSRKGYRRLVTNAMVAFLRKGDWRRGLTASRLLQ